ncbi:uncharacterized protein [Clytia hemisphaerica]|uniref:Uncharacterized protein n=1 Tax=Clytia hemisphaerica TaxID=252671 RepID=A0A7M6DPQ1_9CNID
MRVIYLSKLQFKSLKKEITCLLSFIFAILAIIQITHHESRVNYHCLLFGKISERDRLFEEGSIPLCLLYVLTQYFMAFSSLFLWYHTRKFPEFSWAGTIQSRICWAVWFLYLLSMYTTVLLGIRSICNSLTTPICDDSMILYIDFKVFKPKYFDAWYFLRFWKRSMIFSSLCMVSTMLFCFFNWSSKDDTITPSPPQEKYTIVSV